MIRLFKWEWRDWVAIDSIIHWYSVARETNKGQLLMLRWKFYWMQTQEHWTNLLIIFVDLTFLSPCENWKRRFWCLGIKKRRSMWFFTCSTFVSRMESLTMTLVTFVLFLCFPGSTFTSEESLQVKIGMIQSWRLQKSFFISWTLESLQHFFLFHIFLRCNIFFFKYSHVIWSYWWQMICWQNKSKTNRQTPRLFPLLDFF